MTDYVIRAVADIREIPEEQWDRLVDQGQHPSPFMRHAYLRAMQESGSATTLTGWAAQFVTIYDAETLVAACPLYIKDHSFGEYVFDWAWARAYAQHQVPYYPKAVVAVPFTPVSGDRLLAISAPARDFLVRAMLDLCRVRGLSSLHVLFASPTDIAACDRAGLRTRQTVQFHWNNLPSGYPDFEAFLATLTQEKRKKIRQERRKVQEAGVTFQALTGEHASDADWDFFYRCYERTYLEHGNPPYLSRDFFHRMRADMPNSWLLLLARRAGQRIACSLVALGAYPEPVNGAVRRVAYGRYWGALERVDCLHFETCFYQSIEWCIANGYQCFEGGAQGEHKMSRALLPVATTSAHWISHPAFRSAVEEFLQREGTASEAYMEELKRHSPFKRQVP